VKCYIDNSVRLRWCIRNINKHFWRHCRGGSQYLLSVYRLHGIILSSLFSLTDLSAAMWLFLVVTGKCFVRPESQTAHHLFPRFTSRFISTGLLGSLIRQVSKKSNQRDLGMNFRRVMGALSWSHDRSPNRWHGRLEIHPGILLWVVTRS
jgi:hypothetical protein